MSVRKKPDKAVPLLLDRLSNVEDQILDMRRKGGSDPDYISELVGKKDSKLMIIKDKLEELSKSMSRIKDWEKTVVDKLCDLEKALDNAERKSLAEVREILAEIDIGVGNLESYISTEKDSVTLREVETSRSEHAKQQQQQADPRETILDWDGLGAEDEMMESEAERIHCPDDHLMCLLCLSVFTESTPIKKRPLIYWWMGEGLVSKEEEGESVFQRLLDEGFIDDKQKGGFTLSPWVRRVLISRAKKIGFFEFSTPREGVRPCNSKRRAFLWDGGMDNAPTDKPTDKPTDNPTHKLTVFNINEQYLVSTKMEWLRELHNLEVLQMGRWQASAKHHIEAADNYEKLLSAALDSKEHLKYLSLRGISRIETLPAAAIRKLVSLRILDLRACHNLKRLPDTISQLSNLTHLDVSECYMLEGMPKGFRHLLKLQVLKGFVVRRRIGSCKIAELRELRKLRKLSIVVRGQVMRQLESLEKLSALSILTILWMGNTDADSNTHALATVKLPSSLTRLDLLSVPFTKLPEWLKPSKLPATLEKLRIRGGKLKELPDKNNHEYVYKRVNSLRLQCLEELTITLDNLEALFPNYLYLEKTDRHKNHPDIILTRKTKPSPPMVPDHGGETSQQSHQAGPPVHALQEGAGVAAAGQAAQVGEAAHQRWPAQ